ncbi:MAG TPA: cation-transporting P-type ATPase [Mycobacteriales bacterium]|nr:cation-transporting P-type ATPase [Mycobacteriales bacterium]
MTTTARELAPPWARPAAEVCEELGTGPGGLSEEEAARRLAGGRNVLPRGSPPSLAALVGGQLRDTFIRVLLAAGLLTLVIGDASDTAVIGLVVAVNTALGVRQERQAQRAVDALSSLAAPTAALVRAGEPVTVPAEEVVVGDVLVLRAGDLVAADARLLTAVDLCADEAALTGESAPATKTEEPSAADALVADRTCVVHAGTVVTQGRGTAVVVATGPASEVGRLAGLVATTTSPRTPLQLRLDRFGRQVALLVVGLCGLVLLIGVLRGEPLLTMTLAAITLAVAAVPESLPAVVAVSLALAAKRMAACSAVARSLPAVEALGAVTVIAADKTGTLTEGRMSARAVWADGATATATGEGYAPTGTWSAEGQDLTALLEAVALCNDAELAYDGSDWVVTGDPLEGALLALVGRAGLDAAAVRAAAPRTAELPFDHVRARMTTAHARPDGGFRVVCKGSPESVLGLVEDPAGAAAAAAAMAEEGLRVLAVAAHDLPRLPEDLADLDAGLELLGLVGLHDPPRAAAAGAVRACVEAGVVPLMITGDHPRTAAAVARRIGLLRDGDVVVTGADLAQGRGFDLDHARVFARTAPEQKLGIVDELRAAGHVVAMTGDGVNDAPALRRADVGVAMGRSGSEVARQAADLVLLDDDFATIVEAVAEGRRVYDNIRRFLVYGLAGGAAEVLIMLVGPALGMALPLLPAQVLWVNLLTHGLPGVALGTEPGEPDSLRRPPRDPAQGVLAAGVLPAILGIGTTIAAVSLVLAEVAQHRGLPWQSMLLVTLTMQQLYVALVLRSARRSVVATGLRGNPSLLLAVLLNVGLLVLAVQWGPLLELLGTRQLTAGQLGACSLVALATPVGIEVAKAVLRRTRGGVAAA